MKWSTFSRGKCIKLNTLHNEYCAKNIPTYTGKWSCEEIDGICGGGNNEGEFVECGGSFKILQDTRPGGERSNRMECSYDNETDSCDPDSRQNSTDTEEYESNCYEKTREKCSILGKNLCSQKGCSRKESTKIYTAICSDGNCNPNTKPNCQINYNGTWSCSNNGIVECSTGNPDDCDPNGNKPTSCKKPNGKKCSSDSDCESNFCNKSAQSDEYSLQCYKYKPSQYICADPDKTIETRTEYYGCDMCPNGDYRGGGLKTSSFCHPYYYLGEKKPEQKCIYRQAWHSDKREKITVRKAFTAREYDQQCKPTSQTIWKWTEDGEIYVDSDYGDDRKMCDYQEVSDIHCYNILERKREDDDECPGSKPTTPIQLQCWDNPYES